MITTPGIYPAITTDAYHADPCPEPSLSSTIARVLVGKSPLHGWTAHPRLNPDHAPKVSEAFDIGNVCHRLLLLRGAGFEVVDAENWTTKAAREQRDAIRAEGLVPLLPDQHARAVAMHAKAIRALADYRIALDPMQREVAFVAQLGGIWCRCRLDAWDGATIYDYKTCESAEPDACIRSVSSYGYDVQAAWYCEVVEAVTGKAPRFRFIFQEKDPPHEVTVAELVDDMAAESDWMAAAREKCDVARRLWRRCLDSGEWPGYPRAVVQLGAPGWHTARWRDRPLAPDRDALAAAARWQAPTMEEANG